jgi:DNA repair exonuclease SbcCD ATPase subunit
MNIQRLYIENFMCHETSFIDFTQFNAALIIGKVENNDAYSNGVGKTTIFKAIEYVLFNQADVNLEKIIRDDSSFCKIVLDFKIDDQEYRVSRKRTKKGITDLSLFKRNSIDTENNVYHDEQNLPVENELYWNNISSRRAVDTEKDLESLIKINFKSFRSTIHFLQNDFTGLTTATPEKRKLLLKEALNLLVYSKLEKIAKEKAMILSKEIERNRTIIDNLGNPSQELKELNIKLLETDSVLETKNLELNQLSKIYLRTQSEIQELNTKYSITKSKFSDLLDHESVLSAEKNRLEISVKEYTSKKNNIIKSAKDLIKELQDLKDLQIKLIEVDYSQIDILNAEIVKLTQQSAHHAVIVQNNMLQYEELKIPVPDDEVCKHCRQPLTEEHKKFCKLDLKNKIADCLRNIDLSKKEIAIINKNILHHQQLVNTLNLSKQQLESVNTKITSKNKEIQDKKAIHNDYSSLLDKFVTELSSKTIDLEKLKNDLANSSMKDAENIKCEIDVKKTILKEIENKTSCVNKELAHFNATKAIINHSIDQKNKDNIKLADLYKDVDKLQESFIVYPSVLQAFSSTGIPNLIIQNVLDDLQIEANTLLSQLRPGLQLSFIVEKIKNDGGEADTLDIKYFVGGRERYYEQLSGAMKLAVTFSLKLGLSFLLQKMIGTNIRFLLLDEIDQSLDKASVDAFADIVKFFQKDFIILIITHNDRLKDKFSHAILVEQDSNMISRAKVVNSW